MSVFLDPTGGPIEIAPGRGDLRYSSYPPSMRLSPGNRTMAGGKSISYGELFATQPWIAAATMRMLTWCVRVPINCYRRKDDGSRTLLTPDEHPLARMLKRPWLGQERGPANQSRLVQSLLGPMLVHGNCVTEIETVGGEEWLRPLDWRDLQPIGTMEGEELAGWRLAVGTQHRIVPLSSSLHLAWWSPLGPLGISPLEQLGVTTTIEDSAQRYQMSLFKSGARPPSAITSTPEFLEMEPGDRQSLMDQLRDDVEALYTGPDQAGKPAVLPPGLDWKPVGHTAVEAALIDQRKVSREEVAAVYQIPQPMMGILDKATYSNVETMKELRYSDALGPPLVMIEQTLTSTIARDYFGEDDVFVEFDFGPVLRGDRLKEIQTFREGIANGIYTVNEARRAFNLEASPEEDADKLWLQMNNLTPLGERPASQEPEEPGEEEPEDADADTAEADDADDTDAE